MRYQIAHWQGTRPPVPEAVYEEGRFYVEVENLHAFCQQHGSIILAPPEKHNGTDWLIWVQSSGSYRFTQS